MAGEQLRISYPSGRTLNVFGKFAKHGKLQDSPDSPYGVAVEILESTVIGNQVMSSGSVAMIDPRSVIVGEESGLLYNPRRHYEDFDAEMKGWMEANPGWPSKKLIDPQDST